MKTSACFTRTALHVAIAAVGLATVVSLPAMAKTSVINIGVIGSQGSLEGKSTINAAKLAVQQINAAGGINGEQVKLFTFDDHASAADATRAFQRAVRQDHTVAVVGSYISEVALTLEPWAARLHQPYIVIGAASPKVTERIHKDYNKYKYVFRESLNSIFEARSVQSFVGQSLVPKGYTKAAVMSEDAAWTIPLDKTWDSEAKQKAGVTVLKTIRYSPNTNDFSPIFSQIKATGADIILTGWAHTGLRPTVQWKEGKIPALLVGVNAQAGSSSFWKDSNGAANGVITQTAAVPTSALTPKTEPFAQAYKKAFDQEPAYTGYTTYDAIYLLANAIKAAKSTNADKMVNALEKTSYTGTTGHIEFYGKNSPYTHDLKFGPGLVTGVMAQWQDGQLVPVWPKSVAKPITIPSFVHK